MTARTVTVRTRDHGSVTVVEPAWCLGEGHDHHGDYRSSIVHTGEDTPVMVRMPGGRAELLSVGLQESPFIADPIERGPSIVVQLLDGYHALDAAGLELLARELVEAASQLRREVRRLQVEGRLGGAQ